MSHAPDGDDVGTMTTMTDRDVGAEASRRRMTDMTIGRGEATMIASRRTEAATEAAMRGMRISRTNDSPPRRRRRRDDD